jgi:hypothetical protein
MKTIISVTCLLILGSCSLFEKGHSERKLQTEILQKLANRQDDFSGVQKRQISTPI